MKMQVIAVVFVIFFVNNNVRSLIVPDEIPTLLSLIYSNIPTLKKGTDSRLGWGFRLGERADFQVLVELGPQQNTQPLANQGSTTNKRNVANNLVSTLYANKQKNNQISNTDGGKFIDEWSKEISQNNNNQPMIFTQSVPLGIGEIDAKEVIPDDSISILQKMYKNTEKSSTQKTITTTSEKEALDNVSLDDE